jgi:hypothetical protein
LDKMEKEYHICLYRKEGEKLGIRLAVKDNGLGVVAITGFVPMLYNKRCRSSKIEELLDNQLLACDLIVNVNGEIKVKNMLEQFWNYKVNCFHMKVRRFTHKVWVRENYDAKKEPELGYLSVSKGTQVEIQANSQASADPRSIYQCDYVYAVTCQRKEPRTGGWIPLAIVLSQTDEQRSVSSYSSSTPVAR